MKKATVNGFEIVTNPCPMTHGYFYVKVTTPSGMTVKFEGFKKECAEFLKEVVDTKPTLH